MEKSPRLEGQFDREKEPTPQELAQSWLSSKQEQVEKSIQTTQQGLRFNETYEPKFLPKRASQEAWTHLTIPLLLLKLMNGCRVGEKEL